MMDADITTPPPGADVAAPVNSLFHAGKWLLGDMLSTLIFVGLYAITKSVFTATALAIALGLGQIAYLKFRGHPIDAMQWLMLGLVLVFGGAALITHNAHFIMLKPTLIYTAVGTVMLKPGWMNRYMPPIALARGGDIIFVFGYVWAGLMFATALANLVLALYASPVIWAWFLGVFPLASKCVLFAVQYATARFLVRRRVRAAA